MPLDSNSTAAARLEIGPLGLQARRAIVLVLLSGFLNSFGGLILRSIEEASEWQIVFLRTGSFSIALFVYLFWGRSSGGIRSLRNVGLWGLICALFFCNMQTMFIISLSNTTVANTAFILSAAPIVTAFVARLVLGEVIRPGTWIILFIAAGGVGLMVAEGLATGSVLGDLAAVGCMLSLAGFVVTLRAKREVDMLPALVLGGLLASFVSFGAIGGDASVPARDLLLCLFWGAILSSVVLAFFTMAARHLKGAVVTVLLMIEYVLGPLWVWLFINEQPTLLALLGGAMIFGGVGVQAYISRRDAGP